MVLGETENTEPESPSRFTGLRQSPDNRIIAANNPIWIKAQCLFQEVTEDMFPVLQHLMKLIHFPIPVFRVLLPPFLQMLLGAKEVHEGAEGLCGASAILSAADEFNYAFRRA